MATLKQIEEFKRRKDRGKVGKTEAEEKSKRIAESPKLQKRRKQGQLVAEIASLAIPGLGAAKIGKALATRGPNFVKNVRTALNSKDNKDALRLAFGLDKKVGSKKSNLVTSRFKKGPDGKPLGARPISKAAQEKAKQTRTAAAVVGTAAAGSIMGSDSKKSTPKKTTPKKTKPIKKPAPISTTKKTKPQKTKPEKDPTEGGRFAFYPGQTSKDLGLMYEVDKNKMSDEIRERLEEEELYEGDFMGGRVGKGKKKKVSKAPRGVRAALRGFKTMKASGKVGRQSKGNTNRWV